MMEEGEEKGRGFKVEDRRRFSSEGDLKPEHHGEPETVEKTEEKPAAHRHEASGAETVAAHESVPRREAVEGFEAEGGDITFASFIVGLSTEALAFLGEMPNPETGSADPNLEAAQQIIDILGILREKTRGNLNRDEESLLDAVLFDLRMKYVEKARAAVR